MDKPSKQAKFVRKFNTDPLINELLFRPVNRLTLAHGFIRRFMILQSYKIS